MDEVQIHVFNTELYAAVRLGARVCKKSVVIVRKHSEHRQKLGRVRGAHILQAVIDGRWYVQSMEPRELRSDEHVPSRESALSHGSPGFLLVFVPLSGICQCMVPVSGVARLEALVYNVPI